MQLAIFLPFSIAKNNEVQIYHILVSPSVGEALRMQHRSSKINRVKGAIAPKHLPNFQIKFFT
jgi:hypothetical protein